MVSIMPRVGIGCVGCSADSYYVNLEHGGPSLQIFGQEVL